jgi:hypothetical protein
MKLVMQNYMAVSPPHGVEGFCKSTPGETGLTHHVVLLRRLLKGRVPHEVLDPSHVDGVVY